MVIFQEIDVEKSPKRALVENLCKKARNAIKNEIWLFVSTQHQQQNQFFFFYQLVPMENSGWDYGVPIINIVGENFCVPYTMEMLVKKRIHGMSNAHYDVFDISGNLLLQVDGSLWKFQKKRVMRDPAGIPLLTMRQKVCKCFSRCAV